MNKIYDLELLGDKLVGESEDGYSLYEIGTPVFYNSYTGVMYTEKGKFLIMSFAHGEAYQTNEYIKQSVDNVWQFA